MYYGIMYHTIFHYNILFVILYYIIHYDIIIDIVLYNALSSQSHKNKKIVWKHGPYNAFRSVMLRFHGWSLSKGVQSNKNGFRQERFSLRGWPQCYLSYNWCRYVWEWWRYGIRDCNLYQKCPIEKIVRSNASFVQKFVYPKQVYQGSRKQNINSTLPLIAPAIVILVVWDQDWNLLTSV